MKSITFRTWKKVCTKSLAAAVFALALVLIPAFTVQAASTPSLNKTSRNILIKGTYDLNVKNAVEGSTYVWTSSNKNVATVDEDGVVKGKIKGSTVITCKVMTPADKEFTLTCKVTVKKGAEALAISNKATALNVGQIYDANSKLTPATSNDVTTWTSSNTAIATVDKSGKITALKKGTVTITGKTISGVSDKMTIKVVGITGAVKNQEQLEALLGSGVQTITLSTAAEVTFTVPKGTYKDTKLVVDAPFAEVYNNGLFSSVEIFQVAANTYYDAAWGNKIVIHSANTHVVVEDGASVSVVVSEKGAVVRIENNGVIREILLEDATDLEVTGTSTTPINVVVNTTGTTITSSAPLAVTANAPATLTLLPGAERTTVAASTTANIPVINGSVTIPVTVGSGTDQTPQVVKGKDLPGTTPNTPASGYQGGGTSGGTSGGGTAVYEINKVINTDGSVDFVLTQPYTQLTSIAVKYKGITYTVQSDLLDKLEKFISNDAAYFSLWNGITRETRIYDGQQVKIEGSAGSGTKTVTFVGGLLGGKAYTVSAASTSSVTVTSVSGLSFTLTRISDYTLRINTNVADLVFDPAF